MAYGLLINDHTIGENDSPSPGALSSVSWMVPKDFTHEFTAQNLQESESVIALLYVEKGLLSLHPSLRNHGLGGGENLCCQRTGFFTVWRDRRVSIAD